MMVPDQWADTEVNFASGSASIGEIVIEVLDPQTGGTQAQRGFTAKLADSSGRSALSGRRALVEDSEDGYAFRTIFDGVINRVELSDSLSSFFISIRDIREREREVELFRFTETCSVLPAGVLNGYGIPYAGAPTTEWLVPPTAPVTGVFRLNPSQLFGEGFVDLSEYVIGNTSDGVPIVRSEVVMSDAAIAASASTGENPRIRVLWRAEGSTGSYTTVNVGSFVQAAGTFVETIGAWVGSEDGRPVNAASRVAMPNGFGLANTLPANLDRVEIIVQYIGETSEDWPLHIEEVTAGELIRNIYEGDYSEEDPRVRFDETSILALNTPVRARITEPVTDAREWVERNLYVAAGAAPAIIDGVVHAVTYELPDVSVEVTELGNAEADVMPGWAQSTDDAVNVVQVVYPRDRSVAPDEPGYDSVPGDRVVSREIIEKRIVPESISLLGEKRQTFRVDVLRAIGGPLGEPYSGDVADETGAQVAKRIGAMMTDRFALGGQTFVVMADRTLPDVEDLNVGDWVVVTTTWTPDYQTGERGGNRLGQIVARRDQSPIRCELVIQDAGPDAQPLIAPTLGTLTQTGLGEVQVPIATVPSGAVARVDYAISTTQPAIGSSLWTFAGRAAATETVTTPQLPSGKKVWIRARSEGVGRRPSGYTTPVQIDVTAVPRLRKVFGYVTDDGVEIFWFGNPTTAGVRIEYVAHPFGEAPDYSAGDTVDTNTSPRLLIDSFDRSVNSVLSFRVTPFPTFSGGSVSGTPGQPLESSVFIGLDIEALQIPFGYVIASIDELELEFVAQGNSFAAGGKWAVRYDVPPEDPDDPNAEETGFFEGPFSFEQVTLTNDPAGDAVWVGVWFYDDFDTVPIGEEGPRVLARAIEQPLRGTLQPDLVVRVEYDDDDGDPIARVIATVDDPFLRARPVDPMTAFVDTGPIDEIPELDDPLWVAQPIETSGPYDGSYVWEVPLTEKHFSVAALAFYWLDADATERVINKVLWLDVGDDANIFNINVSYDDRTATVTVKGDADTAELFAEESDDGDPAGTWYSVIDPTPSFAGDRFSTNRRGSFSVQTRLDRERFFRVFGKNFDGNPGPFEFFQVDRAIDVVVAENQLQITDGRWTFGQGTSGQILDRQIALDLAIGTLVRSIRVAYGPTVAPTGSAIEGFRDTDVDGSTIASLLDFFVREETGTPGDVVDFPPTYDAPTQITVIAYDDVGGGVGTGSVVGQQFRVFYPDDNPTTIAAQGPTGPAVLGDRLLIGSGLALSTVSGNPSIAVTAVSGVSSITGTTNQVIASASTGDVILSLPQNVNTTATPTFGGATIDGSIGVRAASTTSSPTQIPVFTADPASTTRTIVTRTPAQIRGDIGAGTGNGTVTSVGGTGTVSGISLSGTVTTSGNLTLGGSLSVNLATNVGSSVLPIANGGTNSTTAEAARTALGAGTVSSVSGGDGLTGTVTSSGSISMGTPSNVGATSSNSTTSTSHTHALDGAIADVTVSGSAPTGTPARAGSLHFVA
jgi:hypothetical protein